MKLSIVIPAHNEEKRILRTLKTYYQFFDGVRAEDDIDFELLVVLNGCSDNTFMVVEEACEQYPEIQVIDISDAGKGLAVKQGFMDALSRPNDLIGFVDADMATGPQYFYDLVLAMEGLDGVIASRYAPGAKVNPSRPPLKRFGSRFFYEPLVRFLFGLNFYDLQCGAKVFKRAVIKKVAPLMAVKQWGFDVELLYLCKKYGFVIGEHPTVWNDQDGSKLSVGSSGIKMVLDLLSIWKRVR